jgi:RimJ/RimL family protein N-acetyltransferase
LRVDDAAQMVTVLADTALYAFTGGEPPTEDALRRRYAAQVRGCSPDGTHRWYTWVVRRPQDQEPVGYTQVTLHRPTRTAELAWVIGVPWQGQGLAGAAAEETVRALDAEDVLRWVAHIHPEHDASAAVARRLGLRPTTRVVDGEVEWERLSGR